MNLRKHLKRLLGIGLLAGLIFITSVLFVGCQKSTTGTDSSSNALSVNSGTVSGKVTNKLSGGAVTGVKLAVDPAVAGVNIETDKDGMYSANLPIGTYKINLTKNGYTSASDNVNLVAGLKVTKNFILVPAKPVAVSAGTAQQADPGATITLKASAEPLDGSTIKTYAWTQVSGTPATLGNSNSETLSVTLNNTRAYKIQLIKGLKLLDRFTVQGINPEALIAAETAAFKVTVTTSSGSYTATANVTANLPYEFTNGIADVPRGVPVLLNGKNQASYNWTMVGPPGSKITFDDSVNRNPVFTPDIVGKYTINEKVSGTSLVVYAGTWTGMITGQDSQGKPLAAGCTTCHDNKIAPDEFTTWSKTGHAEIFTQNINDPAGHWAINCAECHTVGYEPGVNNNGFDEAMAAENWKVPPHGDAGLWTEMLAKDPKTSQLANIQCENCHGPNNGTGLHANGTVDSARISLSSDVCASCHGEPPRHGRFQQWEESSHANYDLAISESTSSSCARCHTAQGFLTWIAQGDLTKQIQGKNGNATAAEMAAIVTPDTAQPVTCVVCHDPHNEGTTTGLTTNADPRIINDTQLLPAGFSATAVGKGAICITCHNTRNSVHNDSVQPTSYQAPHTAAQGDVLMGESAYFVDTDSRSPHSLIQDTCVTCHMEKSPAPADYSLPDNSSNHDFAADITICAKCHTDTLNGEALQAGFSTKLSNLSNALTAYMMKKLPDTFTILEYTPHTVNGKSYDMKADPVSISKSNIASISLTEPHGQQGYILKLKTAVTFTYKPAGETPHTQTLTTIQAQLGDFTTDGKTAVIAPTDNMVKAGWNYFLVNADGSKGVHNPQWEIDVIDASLSALK